MIDTNVLQRSFAELLPSEKAAEELRGKSKKLTEEEVKKILDGTSAKKRNRSNGISPKLCGSICEKCMEGLDAEQMAAVVEQALTA